MEIITPTIVKLHYGNGTLRAETNGHVAAIEIVYEGKFNLRRIAGADWIIGQGAAKVLIIALKKVDLPPAFFIYTGKFKILSAKAASWEAKYVNTEVSITGLNISQKMDAKSEDIDVTSERLNHDYTFGRYRPPAYLNKLYNRKLEKGKYGRVLNTRKGKILY